MSRRHDIKELVYAVSEFLPIEDSFNLCSVEVYPVLMDDEWVLGEVNKKLEKLGVELELVVDQIMINKL